MARAPLHVVAGVLRDTGGRVLLTQRPAGKDLAGTWEFPGGKCEPGEAPAGALRRELHEELGIDVGALEKLIAVPWQYAEKSICLDVYIVRAHAGTPHGREGQALQWVEPQLLAGIAMPPADKPVVTALRLPRHYPITADPADGVEAFLAALQRVLDRGEKLIQLRSKRLAPDALRRVVAQARELCARAGARLLLNEHALLAAELGLDGVHLPAATLLRSSARPLPAPALVGASCHDARELAHAAAIGVDFAVLGPVAPTATHADQAALGWTRFAQLCAGAQLPVFALGGMRRADLETAIEAGAQGIAGISAFGC